MKQLQVVWEVRDGVILAGGKSVLDLYREHDDRPLYVYDLDKISDRISQLRSVLADSAKLHYAVKANPHPEVVAHMATLVDGLDVASAGELEIAVATQIPPEEISFAGPGKTDRELERAIGAGIVVNVESENELRRLASIADVIGTRPRVAIRINPDFELKSSGMRMSGGPKPFGIDAERAVEAIGELRRLALDFQGLHIFCGSQNLRADAICEAQSKSMDLALATCEAAGVTPRFVNVGGGLGIPYFPGDEPVDLEPVGDNLAGLKSRLRSAHPGSDVVVELGRFLVGEAGLYVCRVVDRKVSRGQTYLITNGGLHHHLALSGNFGQIIRKNYPVVIGNRMNEPESERVNIVGPLCTPLDILGDKVSLPRAEPGDLVVVKQSGAYGFTASPHLFLSHPAPVEIIV